MLMECMQPTTGCRPPVSPKKGKKTRVEKKKMHLFGVRCLGGGPQTPYRAPAPKTIRHDVYGGDLAKLLPAARRLRRWSTCNRPRCCRVSAPHPTNTRIQKENDVGNR